MLLLCFYVVLLLSKLEARKSKNGGGGKKVEQLPVKIKRGNYVFKCENYGVFVFGVFLQKHYKIGFRPILTIVFGFLGAKGRVDNWATVRSITRPRVGSYFFRHMWFSY